MQFVAKACACDESRGGMPSVERSDADAEGQVESFLVSQERELFDRDTPGAEQPS
ncbi:hypothetical protein [Ornithinimicrobium murale]|uniref:hypothetical protein n=1 Tax=Ornithinimicrobium murale TaxID=1050153 RepID=UPI0013B42FA9|nr:hypothetical protein [Ornithinimicrobium murale]